MIAVGVGNDRRQRPVPGVLPDLSAGAPGPRPHGGAAAPSQTVGMDYDIEVVELPSRPAAVVRRAGIRAQDVGGFVPTALEEVVTALRRQGVLPAGPPFTRAARATDGRLDLEVGLPTEAPIRDTGRVAAAELPAGRAVRARHVGPYAGVREAHEAVTRWMTERGLVVRDVPWESHLDGADSGRPRTDVVVPCRAVA